MARDIISEQQNNIEFVKAVKQHPCLYNSDLPAYSRRDLTEKAWLEISKEMKMTPSSCRERWRNIRAVFMRNLKIRKGAGRKKPYYLADMMQFVIPYMRVPPEEIDEESRQLACGDVTRDSTDSDPFSNEIGCIKVEALDMNDEENNMEFEEISVTPQPTKRLRDADETVHRPKRVPPAQASASSSHTRPAESSENEAVKSFVNSLLPELNDMNTAQFKCFKRRVLVLIDDITAEIHSDT